MPPNGKTPMVRGQHVQPGPMSFEVNAGWTTSSPPQRVIKLHVEHSTGSTELIMDAGFAGTIGKALIAATSGLQIATS